MIINNVYEESTNKIITNYNFYFNAMDGGTYTITLNPYSLKNGNNIYNRKTQLSTIYIPDDRDA